MPYKRKPEAARRKRQRQYQRLRPQIAALYDELFQRFPQTFFRAPAHVHPLQIGIFHELCTQIAAPRKVVHYVMRRYTRQQAYLQALAAGKPRLDLAGQAVGTVTDRERAQAQARLTQTAQRRRPPPRPRAEHPEGETPPPAPPPRRERPAVPETWQRVLGYLATVQGPCSPATIGQALAIKNPRQMLRRMCDRGLVRQIKVGLYEARERDS